MTAAEPKRFPRALAIEVAQEIHGALAPQCWKSKIEPKPRLTIAGSVRRGRDFVKDLELVFIPAKMQEPDPQDMFGAQRTVDAAEVFFQAALTTGFLSKRPRVDGTFTWGREIKLAIHTRTGLPVDFFAATEENWWNLLVCRTGGADTNIRIAAAAKAKGWRWVPNGPGFLRPDHYWLCMKSERDVFRAVGLDFLEPRHRP